MACAEWLGHTGRMASELSGKRVLVVEDSPVVAPFAEAILELLGAVVIGPAGSMADARELSHSEDIDVAVVDVRIRGEKSYAICEILTRRSVPFVLTSGYADWSLPEEFEDRPQLPKPYNIEDLEKALLSALSSEHSRKF